MNQENSLHYGLTSFQQAFQLAVNVCDLLGHGANRTAVHLLLETAAAETQLGTFADPTPNGAGSGLTQGDPIAVKDVRQRTRGNDAELVRQAFEFDVYSLQPEDLREDPLKALVFTRLFYKLRPEPIPVSAWERARYWKTFYNTVAGSGTQEHYIHSARRWLYGPASPLKMSIHRWPR
ncbi:hypothetical protein [Alteromonas confluentis]|uniref:Uncharacterized protein n=1 Tax=Alteromonas confluentis TaxID=1656094 RepID=A0A1E7ZE47_9ALTE|nr:hypothetical protein [Alteromonas confluentis]OFC71798.1 hypothetical protein BFC18_06490 [Alteromonas confluentis]